MSRPFFSDQQIAVVEFCAEECRRQKSGYDSVGRMVEAWEYAARRASAGSKIRVQDILQIGHLVEPQVNHRGFRTVPVTIRSIPLIDASFVPRAIENLVKYQQNMTPAEFYREYETIHPFEDGNGRSGKILFCWLDSDMWVPNWPPSYWGTDIP